MARARRPVPLAAACALWACLAIGLSGAADEWLIGWLGETYRPAEVWPQPATEASRSQPWIETLSWRPRAFLYHSFLSDAECDHLIKLGAPQMKRSMVVSSSSENGEVSDYRSSYGCFLNRMQDKVVTDIMRRLSEWTHLPMINQEDVQILRYADGQTYRPHMDVLAEDDEDGRRQATALIYLSDVEAGGETAFPKTRNHNWVDPGKVERMENVSACAKGHIATRARKGDALLFFSLKPDGKQDFMAEHTGCPVESGTKWTATFWIHEEPFRPSTFKPPPPGWVPDDAGECRDFDEHCAAYKEQGRCESDAATLKGDLLGDGMLGICRKTCGVCVECAPNDKECYLQNRANAGYLNLDLQYLWPRPGSAEQQMDT
ncbi:unnamed protein product [Ostreobium quekettii]|uniref:Fe2OG dioxygenase domain-containing protein n=1 Tax=Ostreobium quekettii TaxID=121088 RepID=A0A8S1ISC9_9CHLO|nr:unnamed protein product [Ostreobium quekettii]|eukprot:evm.model.scf_334.1 EVM.evm.TU.scf_334.1   scf_334:9585-19567(-)